MFEFLNQYQAFIVLIITLIIWVGIVFYLFRLDKKIKQLEKKVSTEK